MKAPPTFSTGDPSYLVVASTSGSASPTILTVSNVGDGVCLFGLRFIEAVFASHDAMATSYPSARSARAGSTRVALIAGSSHAMRAAHVSTATAAPYVSGSVARIPNSK